MVTRYPSDAGHTESTVGSRVEAARSSALPTPHKQTDPLRLGPDCPPTKHDV
jgi:hypothetical protein